MVIQSRDVPVFPEAMEYARKGLIPGGARSNRDFFSCKVEIPSDIPDLLMDIFYDPQTSGGLLISLPSGDAEKLVAALKKEGHGYSGIVGEVAEDPRGRIRFL